MKRILKGVIPIGTPWGGPESRRYLSSFVSMLLYVEKAIGTEKELYSRHERLNSLYLVVSGIGVSTVWSEGLAPFSHEAFVDKVLGDYVERTMAYAGYRYRELDAHAIGADLGATQRAIVDSIDRGVPVLACSPAAEWSIVTGYDDGGGMLIGWDGSNGYWGAPAVKPDGYLEPGLFATACRPETFSRFVIVEGPTPPARSTRDVLAHLAAVMEGQRADRRDRELHDRLADDAFCRAADDAGIRRLWDFASGYVGWYAENRCFVAGALWGTIGDLPDVAGNAAVVASLGRAAAVLSNSHDTCWEGWRALYVKHKCEKPDDEPCGQCGGCLRAPIDEDYDALRVPERRRKLLGLLRIVDENDEKALAEFRASAAAL